MKTVGILGGMGPEATVLLMQRVLAATPAQDDPDHIPLIVHQNPQVPSRIGRLIEGVGHDPAPVLARMVRDLQAAGAQALAMPCNTAHAYAADIVAATPLPFLDMRSATVAVLPKGRIGMPAVRLTGALDGHFAASDLTPIWAKEAAVLALIKAVKRGDVGAAAHAEMARRLAAEMAARSDHILVACTELSLLTGSIATPFTDSLDCLVQAILDFARG